jgi:hypothetical protein
MPLKACTGVLAALLLVVAPAAANLIEDDFEVDSSASYTAVDDGTPDGSVTFAYDYVGAGIPLAPNSLPGTMGGLRLTANDTAGAADAITLFHNTQITGLTSYSLFVDIYMGVTGTSGTTEHAHIGVAGDGATFNQLFSPISGSGHYMAMTGDGGSSSDYRQFKPSVGPVNSGDASYLNDTNTTNNTGSTYQTLFPDTNGSPTNLWTTMEIRIGGGLITYLLDGTPIIQDTVEVTDGFVSLGYGDLFTSVADPFQSQFVVYDNFRVVPEPTSLMLLSVGALALLRRR